MTDVNIDVKAMSEDFENFDSGPPPSYSLDDIRYYLEMGRFVITSSARTTAMDDFGWGQASIVKALSELKVSEHFHKKDVLWTNPEIMVDYYKARGLMGENVYTHFHVDPDEDKLMIISFKEI